MSIHELESATWAELAEDYYKLAEHHEALSKLARRMATAAGLMAASHMDEDTNG